MAISHRTTHIASGLITERVTADSLRPGNVITVNTDTPHDERTQAVVVSINADALGTMSIRTSQVSDLSPAVFTRVGPQVWFHRIVKG